MRWGCRLADVDAYVLVLTEQARQEAFGSLRCDDIALALASLAATRKAELRARMLGRLHQD